jgi:cell division protein FtsB
MPRLRWVLAACLVTILLVVMGTAYLSEFKRAARLRDQVEQRMDELVSLSRSLQKLREQIDFYSTPEGIGRLARDQFNMVSSGEEIYRLEEVPDAKTR